MLTGQAELSQFAIVHSQTDDTFKSETFACTTLATPFGFHIGADWSRANLTDIAGHLGQARPAIRTHSRPQGIGSNLGQLWLTVGRSPSRPTRIRSPPERFLIQRGPATATCLGSQEIQQHRTPCSPAGLSSGGQPVHQRHPLHLSAQEIVDSKRRQEGATLTKPQRLQFPFTFREELHFAGTFPA
jgi:hypothetical protein